jgi:hypothetical protein
MVGGKIGRWRAALRRLAGLVRTAWPKRRLVAEACFTLALAEARLKLFPLKRQGLKDLVPAFVSPPVERPARGFPSVRRRWMSAGR